MRRRPSGFAQTALYSVATMATLDENTALECAALRERAGFMLLDSHQIIRVRGPERLDWLSGMITQECKSLRFGESRYAAAVHEKGKLFGDLFVHALADELLVLAPRASAKDLVDHFEKHIIMEDCEVALDEASRVMTLQGPDSARMRGAMGFEADRLGRGGVDFVIDAAGADALHAQLSGMGAMPVSEAAWEIARIEAGVFRFGVDFGGDNYVQEASITERAVSFNKGCYVGQEVVCRLQMRGHVRRQLVSLVLDGEPPQKGAALDDEAGVITSACWSPALAKSVAIAMVKWSVANEAKAVKLGGREASLVARPVS
jgi:tRNA-modifying protein YgfZ